MSAKTAQFQSALARAGFYAGPLAAALLLVFGDLVPGKPAVTRMAAVAVLIAVWWLTEAIPLAATSLVPLLALPLLGIADGKATAQQYFNSTIVLFLGGFLIALAMERWNLHRRVALWILRRVGASPGRLLLGFMLATGALSMWISNTATAMMMVPIAMALIQRLEAGETPGIERYRIGILLGIAYGASIGGMGTLIGTPPNLILQQVYSTSFPTAPAIGFGQWVLFGAPVAAAMGLLAWSLLTLRFARGTRSLGVNLETLEREHAGLGRMSREEIAVAVVFVLAALLWLTRSDLRLGGTTLPGWGAPFARLSGGEAKWISDGTVAISMALLLFLIPAREGQRILDREVFARLPWGVVLLFGGGFALAYGFRVSGLAAWLGQGLAGARTLPPVLLVALICLALTFLTELTSNTATTQMILPILAGLATAMRVHPLLLMLPATLSASCAFMMPVATPPNAIVFGTERLSIRQMARAGLALNLMGVVVITAAVWLLAPRVFGADFLSLPSWTGG